MIRIITDTTSGLPRHIAQELGIPFLPQIIVFGEQSFRDDTEIDTPTFLQKLRASTQLPKTAAPPPALYTPIYQGYIDQGDSIIVIAPSAEVSGTYRSATVAAQEFPNADIRIIDTRTVAGGLGSIVIQAVKWAKMGLKVDVVETRIREMAKRERVYFLVDTLEYLYKGGRIGGAQALFGSLLQVKPILTLKDGRTEPVETQRTKRRALARLRELILCDCPRCEAAFLTVSHCSAEEEARCLAAELGEILGVTDVPIYEVPPAIVVHGGPGILSASYFMA